MFALLIGIDIYQSTLIPPLSGAVADARAVKTFLLDSLHVPEDHVTILENASASRVSIIKTLQRLVTDARIQRGEPIMMFYAGHGCQAAAPPDWEEWCPNGTVKLTLPYDAFCESGGKVVAPIPNRTLDALLEAITREKGDNIVVIFDACHFVSGIRSFDYPSSRVRSTPLPSGYQIQECLDQDIWTSFSGLRPHVLLSACNSSGQAWETDGNGGVFTAALLDILKSYPLSELRYRDVIMRLDIDSRYQQNPYCEGVNQDNVIFTLASPSPTEYFSLARTQLGRNDRIQYVLDGGAAHGLDVGDEFAIYPDMDYAVSDGILVVEDVRSFSSVMRLRDGRNVVPVGGNSVAKRVKGAKRHILRIYSRPEDRLSEMLSSSHDLLYIVPVTTPEDAQICVYMQEGQAVLHLSNTPKCDSGVRINPTAEELGDILKISSRFFSELDRTSDHPAITEHVQVQIYELPSSRRHYTDAPVGELLSLSVGPSPCGRFRMRQGVSYGVKLINNSNYDLYPTVQFFNPSRNFEFDTLYRPGCSQFRLDVPLKKDGGSLTIGYGSGEWPPLVIPYADGEHSAFLKISLFTRPLDPFYNNRSFRLARHLPRDLMGAWATIIKHITHLHVAPDYSPIRAYEPSVNTFLGLGLLKGKGQGTSVLSRDYEKAVRSSYTGMKSARQTSR